MTISRLCIVKYGAEALTLAFDPNLAGHYFGSNPEDKYEWGSHSNRPVPVFYQGSGSEILDSFIGEGYENYGVEVPGIPDLIDLVHLAETMASGHYRFLRTVNKATGGDDVLLATGDSVLFGGEGDDTLVSTGVGNNRLYGAEGDERAVRWQRRYPAGWGW